MQGCVGGGGGGAVVEVWQHPRRQLLRRSDLPSFALEREGRGEHARSRSCRPRSRSKDGLMVWVWTVAGLAMHERRSGCLAGFAAATSCLIGLHAEFVCEGTRLCRFAGHFTRRCLHAHRCAIEGTLWRDVGCFRVGFGFIYARGLCVRLHIGHVVGRELCNLGVRSPAASPPTTTHSSYITT